MYLHTCILKWNSHHPGRLALCISSMHNNKIVRFSKEMFEWLLIGVINRLHKGPSHINCLTSDVGTQRTAVSSYIHSGREMASYVWLVTLGAFHMLLFLTSICTHKSKQKKKAMSALALRGSTLFSSPQRCSPCASLDPIFVTGDHHWIVRKVLHLFRVSAAFFKRNVLSSCTFCFLSAKDSMKPIPFSRNPLLEKDWDTYCVTCHCRHCPQWSRCGVGLQISACPYKQLQQEEYKLEAIYMGLW